MRAGLAALVVAVLPACSPNLPAQGAERPASDPRASHPHAPDSPQNPERIPEIAARSDAATVLAQRPSCAPLEPGSGLPETELALPIGVWMAYEHQLGCEWQRLPAPLTVSVARQRLSANNGTASAAAAIELDRGRLKVSGRTPEGVGVGTPEQIRAADLFFAALRHAKTYRYHRTLCGTRQYCLVLLDEAGIPLVSLRGWWGNPDMSKPRPRLDPPPKPGATRPAGGKPPESVACERRPRQSPLLDAKTLTGRWVVRSQYLGCSWRPLPEDVELEWRETANEALARVAGSTKEVPLCVRAGGSCTPVEPAPETPRVLVTLEAALRIATHGERRGRCLVLASPWTPVLELAPAGHTGAC